MIKSQLKLLIVWSLCGAVLLMATGTYVYTQTDWESGVQPVYQILSILASLMLFSPFALILTGKLHMGKGFKLSIQIKGLAVAINTITFVLVLIQMLFMEMTSWLHFIALVILSIPILLFYFERRNAH